MLNLTSVMFLLQSVVEVQSAAIQDADLFLSMLVEFSSLGAAMRRVLGKTLTNPQVEYIYLLLMYLCIFLFSILK